MTEVFRNKRVFLTGHTGFKGTWLTMLLNKMGAEVMGYALEKTLRAKADSLDALISTDNAARAYAKEYIKSECKKF